MVGIVIVEYDSEDITGEKYYSTDRRKLSVLGRKEVVAVVVLVEQMLRKRVQLIN